MPLKLVLLVPRRRFIANRDGLGYQIPLGLVFLGGPLIDAGHRVRLVDNDVLGWDPARLARELAHDPPDAVLLGHTGSTAAHPAAMEAARALRRALPRTVIVYGGVYPTYAARSVMEANPEVDVVVRGEGEETSLEVARAIEEDPEDLARVRGITYRSGDAIITNPERPPIVDLDRFRPGWELVDWDRYRLFGHRRGAGFQFSRGCPLRCTYCGQWGFWKRWRHRSAENFTSELEILARRYGVGAVWLADENFSGERETAAEALELLAQKDLGLSLNVNLTAAGVVRDWDLLSLYRRAGVEQVILGIESLDDGVVARVGKDNPFETAREAVSLLRRHGIASVANIIFGLETESPRTLARTFRRLLRLDPDVLNAVYLTPHHWTQEGRAARAEDVIQPDLAFFTYRNQILRAPGFSPGGLFASVKGMELLFHLRPRSLLRALAAPGASYRRTLRHYLATGRRVWCAEIAEFLFRTRWVSPGTLHAVPGFPQASHRSLRTTADHTAAS